MKWRGLPSKRLSMMMKGLDQLSCSCGSWRELWERIEARDEEIKVLQGEVMRGEEFKVKLMSLIKISLGTIARGEQLVLQGGGS